MADPTTVDEYMATLPDERRGADERPSGGDQRGRRAGGDRVDRLRDAGVPEPRGQFLVSYAAFKNHYSLFPASDAVVKGLGDEITPVPRGQGHDPLPGQPPDPDSRRSRGSPRSASRRTPPTTAPLTPVGRSATAAPDVQAPDPSAGTGPTRAPRTRPGPGSTRPRPTHRGRRRRTRSRRPAATSGSGPRCCPRT